MKKHFLLLLELFTHGKQMVSKMFVLTIRWLIMLKAIIIFDNVHLYCPEIIPMHHVTDTVNNTYLFIIIT